MWTATKNLKRRTFCLNHNYFYFIYLHTFFRRIFCGTVFKPKDAVKAKFTWNKKKTKLANNTAAITSQLLSTQCTISNAERYPASNFILIRKVEQLAILLPHPASWYSSQINWNCLIRFPCIVQRCR